MQKTFVNKLVPALVLASVLSLPTPGVAQYADSVVSYNTGTGFAAGYTTPATALGAPTVFIGYQDADPFNSPYQNTHLVSIGAGGNLTLQFNTPILNDATHPFGLDFIVFGNAFFTATNFDPFITDGSLFGGQATTRVSVSANGTDFFTLNPGLAPNVDGLFPTDAAGNPRLPVNPALTSADFAGLDLAGIRALYDGAGGGTGFDLAWALDGDSNPVALSSVSYVRIDVLSGKAEVDALSVVPEPSALALTLLGAGLLVRNRRHPR